MGLYMAGITIDEMIINKTMRHSKNDVKVRTWILDYVTREQTWISLLCFISQQQQYLVLLPRVIMLLGTPS